MKMCVQVQALFLDMKGSSGSSLLNVVKYDNELRLDVRNCIKNKIVNV